MNLFTQRTFSTDWEMIVFDKLERFVGMEKLLGFANALHTQLDLPIQVDWNTLEFALGINTSFAQIWERAQRATDLAQQLLREYRLELVPCGAHPVEMFFNSSHIHVGTVLDETRAIHLENQLIRYLPAFAALAANSPFTNLLRGEYKSYRVRKQAYGCTRPPSLRVPELSQNIWGFDATTKVYGGPTLEVRTTDGASSRRFLAELATFTAAYVHYQGGRIEETLPSADEYRDYLLNRWSAAKHGLQATFVRGGETLPVAEMLDCMLDECAEELAQLGVKRSDLVVIESMLQKRTCQADFALDLASRYENPHTLASAFNKLMRHWTVFEEYLETAPVLDPLPAPDEEAILSEHADAIGEGAHYYASREAMSFPAPLADAMVERLIERQEIRREISERGGVLLQRNEIAGAVLDHA